MVGADTICLGLLCDLAPDFRLVVLLKDRLEVSFAMFAAKYQGLAVIEPPAFSRPDRPVASTLTATTKAQEYARSDSWRHCVVIGPTDPLG